MEDCFGAKIDAKYQVADLSQESLGLPVQYFTQWGYSTVRLSIYPPLFDVNKIKLRPQWHRTASWHPPRSSHAFGH